MVFPKEDIIHQTYYDRHRILYSHFKNNFSNLASCQFLYKFQNGSSVKNISINLWFHVKVMPVFAKLAESEKLLGKGIQPAVFFAIQ